MKKMRRLLALSLIASSLLFFSPSLLAVDRSLTEKNKQELTILFRYQFKIMEAGIEELNSMLNTAEILGLNIANKDQINRTINTATDLMWAALSIDDAESTEKLLNIIDKFGTNKIPDKILDNRFSALIHAVKEGYTKVVELLLQRGVEVDRIDDEGFTALIYASILGQTETVQALIKNNADVNKAGNKGCVALLSTAMELSLEKLKRTTKTNNKDNGDIFNKLLPLFTTFLEDTLLTVKNSLSDKDSPYKDPDGFTPLIVSPFSCNTEVVNTLIKNGAVVDKPDNQGVTALMYASQANCFNHGKSTIEIVKILLDNKADPYKQSHIGQNAIDYAKSSGHPELVPILEGKATEAKDEL